MAQELKIINRGNEPEWFMTWIDTSDLKKTEGIEARCTTEYLQDKLAGVVDAEIGKVEVAFAKVWGAGEYVSDVPCDFSGKDSDHYVYMRQQLPAMCQVIVHHDTPGGHTEHINVWVPLAWNGRYMGATGGGNRTGVTWNDYGDFRASRVLNAEMMVKNGYAAGSTDGGNRDRRLDWQLNYETGELDWELIRNWSTSRCDHAAAVVGKAVTELLHNRKPDYSYLYGNSGGGRQVLMEAVRHPEDYDGYWADCPAIYYAHFALVGLWPQVVMNNLGNVLPRSKYEAFRKAVIEKHGGNKEFFNRLDRVDFDAREVIGTETPDGIITDKDAQVMQMIWDGPRTADGKLLWHCVRPGNDSASGYNGFCVVLEQNGEHVQFPFVISRDFFTTWVMKDPNWDWKAMTIEEYIELFQKALEEFAEIDSCDPDMRNLLKLNKKLFITMGTDDEVVPVDGIFDYYNQVVKMLGGKENTDEVISFFPIPGDGHGRFDKNGAGFSIASGMLALIDWVEHDTVPSGIKGQRFDPETLTIAEYKMNYRY